ncbi:MAG: cell division topological specificity factor MinE [Marinospirillum sp.]|uniref:cell division topological specificity factor MinE n=1 Tax=Marinospirillum sp. TaxID=2183934 RepID=UPI001A105F29|nr:cell division topological specificity factor MinE [Marinospirillum sp.]MBE0508256.1 cell division topological specificity factor MinE [Marinospirillum sp.]
MNSIRAAIGGNEWLRRVMGAAPPAASSATAAKDRLKIILQHQSGTQPGLDLKVRQIQQDILAVLERHLSIATTQLDISVNERKDGETSLEINVSLPADIIESEVSNATKKS